MDQIISILKQTGINDKQAKVYLAALELGSATIQELSEKSGIKRTSIYNFLEEMKQKRLLTEVRDGKHTLLLPEDPKLLLQQAQQQTNNISILLPKLIDIYNEPGNKPKIRYFQGISGLERAYDDLIATKETACGFSDYEKMFKVMSQEYLLNFPPRRVKNGIFFNCVAKNGPMGRQIKKWDKKQMRETRLVNGLELDTEINIYGNKVMLLSFRRPYVGTIIEDSAIALSMKSVWNIVWNGLKNVGGKKS